MELAWGVGVVLLGIGCFGDGVGAGDDLLLEVGAWLYNTFEILFHHILMSLDSHTKTLSICELYLV